MPKPLHQDSFRPASAPARDLPFGVRSVGHHRIQPPLISRNKIINFLQLFWCARGSGIIEFNDRKRVLKQHQVALYYPNMRHFLYSDRGSWEFYYLTIDGRFAVSLPAAFGLEADIYDAGPAPVSLFQTLLRLVGQPSKQAEMQACSTAFAILTRTAGSHADQTDEVVNMAVERMHRDYASPVLNIKTLADALGIHRGAFCARFHAAMKMPPGVYLNRLRTQQALLLLKNSHLTIAEIAGQCGYTDADYFSRVIRRAVGRSPLQFRKGGKTSGK